MTNRITGMGRKKETEALPPKPRFRRSELFRFIENKVR